MNFFWFGTIVCCIPISFCAVLLFDTIISNSVHILLNSIFKVTIKNCLLAGKLTGMLGLTRNLAKGSTLYGERLAGIEKSI